MARGRASLRLHRIRGRDAAQTAGKLHEFPRSTSISAGSSSPIDPQPPIPAVSDHQSASV
eukprot:CAMPEP_0173470320 /NCGR_PEP_ID=MMETSP1357-20121228/77817_1 /TAXON_ID=77926 /ORGANISM="Hemiselmis rufescens, Strain PCC563" /LENGTH=59 /DNA_ID=CAMNT_0014438591 /DNA_START=198 /DNA_END=377 /DNA_ORIENTATION=-